MGRLGHLPPPRKHLAVCAHPTKHPLAGGVITILSVGRFIPFRTATVLANPPGVTKRFFFCGRKNAKAWPWRRLQISLPKSAPFPETLQGPWRRKEGFPPTMTRSERQAPGGYAHVPPHAHLAIAVPVPNRALGGVACASRKITQVKHHRPSNGQVRFIEMPGQTNPLQTRNFDGTAQRGQPW